MNGSKDWTKSRTIVTLIVTLLTTIFLFMKMDVSSQSIEVVVVAVLNFISIIVAAYYRKIATQVIE